jgi:hypothetical protein
VRGARRAYGFAMTPVVILGMLMVGAGLVGLAYCVREGLTIRREKPDPNDARQKLHRLVAVNLGSVALAAFGLGVVVVGFALV